MKNRLTLVELRGSEASGRRINNNVKATTQHGHMRPMATCTDLPLDAPLDLLPPLVLSAPEKAKEILNMLAAMGSKRLRTS